ncbi:MAG: hypothetical protein JNJ82_19870 [Opitutaceae bacterium]|jgi:hypothetical protein|nr:hypothetical protein [Opitutaceae bacterium]
MPTQRSNFYAGVAIIALAMLAGCATPPAPPPAPVAAPVAATPAPPPATLADQIQAAINVIDEVLAGYDGVLSRIQQIPESKDPARIIGEIGSYVGSDRLAVTVVPPESELVKGLSGSMALTSWLAIAETELLSQLVDISRRLIRLNAQTAELAGSYEQGRTLQKYAGKIRRELMPLMAELRRLSVADKADTTAIASLEIETKKIVAASRQSLQALEKDTRAIETELGGR